MSTTAAPTEARGALERMKPTALLGYGLGDFGCNLAFALSTSFLLFYYTDVAGLSAAAIGTMFFVVRIWDAFADLIAGRAVDRTMTRFGKFRPFILFGAVPLLFLSVLTFWVPQSMHMGEFNRSLQHRAAESSVAAPRRLRWECASRGFFGACC